MYLKFLQDLDNLIFQYNKTERKIEKILNIYIKTYIHSYIS